MDASKGGAGVRLCSCVPPTRPLSIFIQSYVISDEEILDGVRIRLPVSECRRVRRAQKTKNERAVNVLLHEKVKAA